MNFEDQKIDKQIVKILKDNNIHYMTPIQQKSVPLILNGHDILGISRTGTGKTLSFLVPILNNLLNINKSMYCLIISPTRELALQIDKTVQLFKNIGVRSLVLIGGEKIEDQVHKLKLHPHIVIGTPGRIHSLGKNLQINRFRVLVLDEADKYFEEDFVDDMKYILENLRKKRQTLFFTATVTDNLKKKSTDLLKNHKEIDLAVEHKIEKLDEFYLFIPRRYKESCMYSLLDHKKDSKVIVFVNMRSTAVQVSRLMKYMNIDNENLNGEQIQETRNEIIDGFIKNKYNVLITTDVGSRGLDVCDVDVVINYDLPQNTKDYVHRVGRTARAGKKGIAISVVTQYDIPQVQKIEHALDKKLNLFKYEESYKQYEDKIETLKIRISEELKEESENKPKRSKK
ncbi:hypothetical protein P3W45_000460 [Vairimorpha bombi]|jgi:ATP-dependent RNA helicase DDX47/RRP3